MRNVFITAAVLTAVSAAAHASIIANFSGGNTTLAVDGYVGMADGSGSSWATPWGVNGSSAFWSNSVTNASPVAGGDHYLALSLGRGASDTVGTVNRRWDVAALDNTQPYKVTFDLRVDSNLNTNAADSNSRVFALGDTSASASGTSSTTTWSIQAYYSSANGVTWGYTDNSATQTTTGVAVTNDPMRFVVNVDTVNFTYSFTMTNLATLAVYNSPVAEFRSKNTGTAKFYVGASTDKDSSNVATLFSLDSVTVVVPEPAGLMGVCAVAGVMMRRRRAYRSWGAQR